MNATLKQLTAMISDREPATEEQVAALEQRIKRKLPPDYREYLLTSNGGEGLVEGTEIILRMYAIDQIESSMELYECRGFWLIGTNNFGMVICLDCRKKAKTFIVATGDSDFTRFDPKCETFEAFLSALGKRAPAKAEEPVAIQEPAAKGSIREICTVKFRKPNDWAMLFPLLSPDGSCFYTIFNGCLTRWDLPTGKKRYQVRHLVLNRVLSTGELLCRIAEKDGKPLSSAWPLAWCDAETGAVRRSLAVPEGFGGFSSVSADGRLGLLHHQESRTIGAVDLASGQVLGKMVSTKARFDTGFVCEANLFPSGRFCLLGQGHDVSIYTVPDFEEVCRIQHPHVAADLSSGRGAISPDESTLLFDATEAKLEPGKGWTHGETTLYAHDTRTGRERFAIRGSVAPQARRAFLPDGTHFLSAVPSGAGPRAHGSLAQFDAQTGQQIRLLMADKTGQFSMVQISADGRIILTYDQDCRTGGTLHVRAWEMA